MRTPFLTAKWRHLAMANYEIDPAVLRPLVPAGTELDSWSGKTLVSVVGFMFTDTRVFDIPLPFSSDFEEVNLRFYVRRLAGREWRRGVVFIREIVPSQAIALAARWLYNEPYLALPMRHTIDLPAPSESRAGKVEYAWRWEGRWNLLRVRTSGSAYLIVPGTEEEFIAEHYWGYTRQEDDGTLEYEVAHPRWQIRRGEGSLDCDVATLYGPQFAEALETPSSVFVAEGSDVTVFRGARLQDAPTRTAVRDTRDGASHESQRS